MGVWKKLDYLQRGVSHIQNGLNCQDSVLVFENEDCIVAALADGLGSLKYSEIAAQVATETVCKCFSEIKNPLEYFDTKEELAQHILNAIIMNMQDKASEMEVPLNEMDCTLMFVCVLKTTMYAIIGRLGDSAICVIAEPKSIAINDGNKSANGTNAILDKDAFEHFEIRIIDVVKNNVLGFILSSDGLENELYMKGSDHVNKNAEIYFNSWFINDDPVTIIQERISKLTEVEETPFDDDISIAVLSRADKEINLPNDPKWLCTCGHRNYLYATYCQKCHNDFSILYQNIRFRDYGGKAKFFTEINKDPEEEWRILGVKSKGFKSADNVSSIEGKQPPKAKTTAVSSIESFATTDSKMKISSIIQNPREDSLNEQKNTTFKTNEVEMLDVDTEAILSKKIQNKKEFSLASTTSKIEVTREQKDNDKYSYESSVPSPKKKTNSVNEVCEEERIKIKSTPIKSTTETSNKLARGRYQVKSKKTRYNMKVLKLMGIFMVVSFVLGVVIGSVSVKNIMSGKVNKLAKSVEKLTDTIRQYEQELVVKETELTYVLPEDFAVLEDGTYFWGELDELGLPDDFGILKENGVYYIGNFSHGKKNGRFSIVSNDLEHYVENYLEGESVSKESEVDEDTNENREDNNAPPFSVLENLKGYEIQYVANMRKYPGKKNDLVTTLKVGTVVYLVDTLEKEVDNLFWVHVVTEEGYDGWILEEALKH